MTSQVTAMTVTRHPVRGAFAGLLLGLGVVLMLFVYGVLLISVVTLAVFALAGAVLGWALARFTPPRHASG